MIRKCILLDKNINQLLKLIEIIHINVLLFNIIVNRCVCFNSLIIDHCNQKRYFKSYFVLLINLGWCTINYLLLSSDIFID